MNVKRKAKHAAQRLTGKAKAAAGHVIGDERLVMEGRMDQVEASAEESVKTFEDILKDNQ